MHMQINIVIPKDRAPVIELANVAVNDDGTMTLTLAEADDLRDALYQVVSRARRIEDM